MTASVTSERPGKRDRLVAGAGEAIYRQGFEATTIAATRDPAVWSQVRRFAPAEGPLDGEELR
jgi:hypothetical protein